MEEIRKDYSLENQLAVLRENVPQLQEQRLGAFRGERVVVLDDVAAESQRHTKKNGLVARWQGEDDNTERASGGNRSARRTRERGPPSSPVSEYRTPRCLRPPHRRDRPLLPLPRQREREEEESPQWT